MHMTVWIMSGTSEAFGFFSYNHFSDLHTHLHLILYGGSVSFFHVLHPHSTKNSSVRSVDFLLPLAPDALGCSVGVLATNGMPVAIHQFVDPTPPRAPASPFHSHRPLRDSDRHHAWTSQRGWKLLIWFLGWGAWMRVRVWEEEQDRVDRRSSLAREAAEVCFLEKKKKIQFNSYMPIPFTHACI